MRRDTLFYRLFSQSPTLLFDLLTSPPTNASAYRFESVAVKEPTFEIDGVFLPPGNSNNKTVYFCEVQFQKDEQLYERLFSELFLYFYRQRAAFDDWQAVVIYPRRSLEQRLTLPYDPLLNSDKVHRIYLNELTNPLELSIGVELLKLTTCTEKQAPIAARELIARAQQEEPGIRQAAIIELITTIMVYRFTNKSRQEVEAMLDLTLQETRFYRDVKEEGREEGREEGMRSLILRQLNHRFGALPEVVVNGVNGLSLEALDTLAEALLDFDSIDEAVSWLSAQNL
ncbi:MAG: Rpn family recombination-promoting nuclease/putative transposase [Leptolyngbyaceae bacterium]|nr:Rpn family recombination-promoting nuclease/putative transposase [Leptolyngbyaceae bacterium]